jgi:hypothetical protein
MYRRKAQSTLEMVTLVTVVIGALLTAQVYFKRGLQGRWRAATDDLGEQYDPRLANGDIRYTLDGNTITTVISVPESNTSFWTWRTDQTTIKEDKSGSMRVGTP